MQTYTQHLYTLAPHMGMYTCLFWAMPPARLGGVTSRWSVHRVSQDWRARIRTGGPRLGLGLGLGLGLRLGLGHHIKGVAS